MTKASTLARLERKIVSATILPQVQITDQELVDGQQILRKIRRELGDCERFVVRSSFSEEDTSESSQAGRFVSYVDVTQNDLLERIINVFRSYPKLQQEVVLVQPYLSNTMRSGVVFTHQPVSGQPYLIDNYVMGSDTESITSGASQGFKHVCLRNFRNECEDYVCLKLKELMKECQQILGYEQMDIEYALDSNSFLYIFQVRPLRVQSKSIESLSDLLTSSQKFVNSRLKKVPFLAGDSTVYGVMPDWNPAEMIGRRPKKLALSLYRELITDSIWAYQRDNYGYKSLRSFPLLVEICNQPFIDTRVSFNSLLPKGLTDELETTLVNYYLSRLAENRNLHDKIEFEIVLSSWTFDIDKRISLLPHEVSDSQRRILKSTLISLTRNVVSGSFIDADIERVKRLIERKRTIDIEMGDSLSELYWLIEDCKRWGTLPFAGLARAAFIATQILKSLEITSGRNGILADFIKDLDTITSQMSRDLEFMDRKTFLEKYGHLRPGTYDITSMTYRESFDRYFGQSTHKRKRQMESVKHYEIADIIHLLEDAEIDKLLGVSALEFLDFARKSIYWREQAKFEFSKNLSGVLDLVQEIGNDHGVNREQLAFLDVKVLLEAYSNTINLEEAMRSSIKQGEAEYKKATAIELPSVITRVSEISSFTEKDASPNFVTDRSVTGLPKTHFEDLSGCIVLIEGADPGYDWIFQKGVIGLITAYGGANSHMAVRCAELNLPAAIGVGERLFSEIRGSVQVNLDCGKRIIEFR